MSTISDALKKAQRQRAGDGPDPWHRPVPPAPQAPLPPPVRGEAEPPERTARLPLAAGLALVAVGLMLGLSLVMMRCVPGGGGDGVPVVDVPSAGAASGSPPAPPVPAVAEVKEPVPPVPPAVPVESAPAPEPPPHKLVGIFYSERNPLAIIDDFSVREGETVGAYRVVRIHPESVTLQRAGEREVELRLK